jgi:hypothetical protein
MSIHYDHWKTTNPADAELGPEPEDEDAPEEPVIEELWDGAGAYIHVVTMRPSGRKFYIRQATGGAFVGDWEICGPGGFFRDGFLSPEKAIDWLVSNE